MADPNFYIETPRLYISYFLLNSANSTFLVYLYNTPLFLASEGLTEVTTPEKALGRIQEFHNWHATYGYGQYLVSLKPHATASFAESSPIGSVSLMRGKDQYSPTAPDIGYCIVPEQNGKGYATEAAEALLRYAREKLGVKDVLGFCDAANGASVKVMEKLGFESRGLREVKLFGGKESAVYALPGMDEDLMVYNVVYGK